MNKSIKILLVILFMGVPVVSLSQPHSRAFSDTCVVEHIRGGFVKKGKLFLITNESYSYLNNVEKKNVLSIISKEFDSLNITVYTGPQQRELWLNRNNELFLAEQWDNDNLQMEKYMPLELKRNGTRKIFYFVGGSFNGGEDYSSGGLNLRVGTYLFENLLDASVTSNIGYSKSGEETWFSGDIGLDGRAYPPFLRVKRLNLSPYAGVGVSWVMPPMNYFELRLLAGTCWFIGPGNLDVGVHYGIESGFSATMGYTFRPRLGVKK